MRIFWHPSRPRASNRDDLGSFPSASRAAHSPRKFSQRHLPADQARECLRLNLTARAAFAHNADQEVAEAVIQSLDVRQHAHARMVLSGSERVHAVSGGVPTCTVLLSSQFKCLRRSGIDRRTAGSLGRADLRLQGAHFGLEVSDLIVRQEDLVGRRRELRG